MGLRQLYFLLGDLLKRLVYLGLGLAVLLAFIGVKLVLHALHENSLFFVNDGEPIHSVPEIPIWLSLTMIVGILGVTAVASLLKTRRDRRDGQDTAGDDELDLEEVSLFGEPHEQPRSDTPDLPGPTDRRDGKD